MLNFYNFMDAPEAPEQKHPGQWGLKAFAMFAFMLQ